MDTFLLRDFEVKGVAVIQNIGSTKINLSPAKFNTLTDALTLQSAIFIKQYGTGGLANAGFRGLGAQHTSVMWNGVNIQSCMNSNLDFNLIPLFFIDKAGIETGANSSSCGNGTLAGAIHLSNTFDKTPIAFANLQRGSFGYSQIGIGSSYQIKKLRFKTRILHRQAENDILFHNKFLPGNPTEKQVNSAYTQNGFLQEAEYKAGNYHAFNLSAWYLENTRELPVAMGIPNLLKERQYDLNGRVSLTHKFTRAKVANTNKLAFLYDQLNYYNNFYAPSYSYSKSLIAESEWLIPMKYSSSLTASLNNNFSTAKTDGYNNWPQRNLLSLWIKLEKMSFKNKLKYSLGSRVLLVDKEFAPFSPDIAFEYRPLTFLKIKGNAAYSYRVPSFNDYYWLQGGNKNLKPERGNKQEISIELQKGIVKFAFTGFHHIVNDWIMWQPSPAFSYWIAQNARQVTSKGIETSIEMTKTFGLHNLQLLGRYQYVESINTKIYDNSETLLGKQLFYTPNHTAFATVNYAFKNILLSVTEQFYGSRYTTPDNLKASKLPSYLLTNASIGYLFKYKKHDSQLVFTVNNALNTTYQIMENKPMPLRNYQITLKFNINK
ncbi:MAG: TonB-dependent receptor [Bacteroidota bacterium]